MEETLNTRATPEGCRGQQGGGGPQTDGSRKWFREVEQAEDGVPQYHAALQPPPRDSEGCCVHYYDAADSHQCGAHVSVGLPVERHIHKHTRSPSNPGNGFITEEDCWRLEPSPTVEMRDTGIQMDPKIHHQSTGTRIID